MPVSDLTLQTQTTLVSDMTAAVQGAAGLEVDVTDGSLVLALLQAQVGVSLWLQLLAVQVFLAGRLATSTGEDVDSFVGDFGLVREPAVPAGGFVTFSRFAAVSSATLLVGSAVRTADGSLSYAVTGDPANPLYVADTGGGFPGYVVPVGLASITVPVICTTPGAAGNVVTGAVNSGGGISGLPTVTNAAPMAGGLGAESDDALRRRFSDYIASLESATPTAIRTAVETVQQGLAYNLQENVDETGAWRPGHFVVTTCTSDGTLSEALQAAVYAAVDRVRPVGSTFSVRPPVVTYADVSMTISAGIGATKAQLIPLVSAAVSGFFASLTVGQAMPYNRLAVLAFGANAAVANVGSILLNNGTSDLTPPVNGLVRLRSLTVT